MTYRAPTSPVPPAPDQGMHYGIPLQDYLAWPYVSKGPLPAMDITPAHWLHGLTAPFEPGPVVIVGGAVDCLLFDGVDPFLAEYAIRPPGLGALSSKAGKAWKTEQGPRNIIPTKINKKEINVLATVEKIRENEVVADILAGGQSQVSLVWQDPRTGVYCKGRPDVVSRDGPPYAVDDLKVGDDSSPQAFYDHVFRMNWHRLTWYLEGLEVITGTPHTTLGFIAAERHPPFGVEHYLLGDREMKLGRWLNRHGLDKIAHWSARGEWPSTTNSTREIKFKNWAFPKGFDE